MRRPWLIFFYLFCLFGAVIGIVWLRLEKNWTEYLGDPFTFIHLSNAQQAFWPWLCTIVALPLGIVLGWLKKP